MSLLVICSYSSLLSVSAGVIDVNIFVNYAKLSCLFFDIKYEVIAHV